MSKALTKKQQQQITKVNNTAVIAKTVAETDDNEEDTELFYANIIDQFKTVIIDQYHDIDEKIHKIKVMDKAMTIKNEETKRLLEEKNNRIKDNEQKIKLLEQEIKYHNDKEISRDGKRADTRRIVQELHDINVKRRAVKVSDTDIDAEAREFLKRFE